MSFYRTLLRVAVQHSYNVNGICSCLKFIPSTRTREVLAATGLLFKETIDGFRLVYDKTRPEAMRLAAEDTREALSFDFKVFSNDADFGNYTATFDTDDAVDTDDKGVFCFDNRVAEEWEKRNSAVPARIAYLQAARYFSRADLDFSASGERRESELRKLAKERDLTPEESDEYQEISGRQDGVLRQINSLLDANDRLLPPRFLLRIFAEDEQGPLLDRWLDESLQTVYVISLASRERYWKYYLTGRLVSDGLEADDFQIVDTTRPSDPNETCEFEPVGRERLSDQRLAFTFRSTKKIPYRERYSIQLELKRKDRNGDKGIKNLPVAGKRQIGKEMIDGNIEVVSEIYINS